MDPSRLLSRNQFPDALRVLLEEFPREGWEADPNFSELIRFWLERHLMFRRLLDQMTSDARGELDSQEESTEYARRLSRFGGMFVTSLHGHHQIEDMHFFPQMEGLDSRVSHGFELLEQDHQLLDGALERFTNAANNVLQQAGDTSIKRDHVAAVMAEIEGLHPMLNRHLLDEEDLIVPVLLKYAPDIG